MNTTLTGLFTLECVMKIFSFGFRVCTRDFGQSKGNDNNKKNQKMK